MVSTRCAVWVWIGAGTTICGSSREVGGDLLGDARLAPEVELAREAGGELVEHPLPVDPRGPPDPQEQEQPRNSARSARSEARSQGYCTFTATGCPDGSCARWTWAIEAAPSGIGLELAERAPRAARRAPPRRWPGCARTAAAEPGRAAMPGLR